MTLIRCLKDLGPIVCRNIQFVCSDMWKADLAVIAQWLRHAVNVFDKFHIVAKLHGAVDQVPRVAVAALSRVKSNRKLEFVVRFLSLGNVFK